MQHKTDTKIETLPETEKRIERMTSENENQPSPTAEYGTITTADYFAETTSETLNAGNDNVSKIDKVDSIVSFNEDDGTCEKVRVRAALNEHLAADGENLLATGFDSSTNEADNGDTFDSSTNEPEQAPDIKARLKQGLDDVCRNFQAWNANIEKAEQYLKRVNGYKHADVYLAFRDMVFFACDCVDNPDDAKELFGKQWENHRPRKCPSQEYLQSINYACFHSGVIREQLLGKETKSMYANIAMNIHQQITDGYISKENFIAKVCRPHGGIDGFYKNAVKKNAKKVVKNKCQPGGKAMTGAEASQHFTDAYNSLKDNQSAQDAYMDKPRLVSVVMDMNKVGSFATLAAVRNRFNDSKFGVVAIEEITEELLEQILKGGDANA